MRRVTRGSAALLLGVALLMAGPGAQAQAQTTTTLPLHAITVTPATVDEPKEPITLAGEGFPGETGCKFGQLYALRAGQTITATTPRLLQGYDFDREWSVEVTRWSDGSYFAEGTFQLVLACTDDSGIATGTYRTDATLTVLPSGVPPPDPTTTEPPTTTTALVTTTTIGLNGTVDPNVARAGETTVTLRGNGFKPLASLQITLDTKPPTVLGTTKATDKGEYATTILIPATAPAGKHKVLVTGEGPDGASRSTTADLQVLAAPGTTTARRTAAAATGGSGTAATGTLAATGPSESTPYLVMAGLTAMTLGAFLVGMSHPAAPSGPRHRRRRRGLHRR